MTNATIPDLRGIPDTAEPMPDSNPVVTAMVAADTAIPVTLIPRMEVSEAAPSESVHVGTYRWTQNSKPFQGEFYITVPPADGSPEMQAIREDTYNRQSLLQDEKLADSGCTNITYRESPACPIF